MRKNFKLILSILALTTFPLMAQASDGAQTAVGIITVVLICFAAFLLILLIFREVVCWYWKINKQTKQLEDIRMLLEKILKEVYQQRGADVTALVAHDKADEPVNS
jgi:hypothetical protein